MIEKANPLCIFAEIQDPPGRCRREFKCDGCMVHENAMAQYAAIFKIDNKGITDTPKDDNASQNGF